MNGYEHNYGKLVLNWALLLVPARCILLVITQGALALGLCIAGHEDPWVSATKWWTVYGTIVDLFCLMFLFLALRKEGLELPSLLDFDRTKVWADLKNGLLVFAVIFPLLGLGWSIGMGKLLLDENSLKLIVGQLAERSLPSWGFAYSIFVWWIVWSITEELTYQAYCLNRLTRRYSKTRVLMFIGFFWAFQHSFLPLIFDWRYIGWRLISFFPLVVGLMLAYIRLGRITPLIFAHALMDINAAMWTFKYG